MCVSAMRTVTRASNDYPAWASVPEGFPHFVRLQVGT